MHLPRTDPPARIAAVDGLRAAAVLGVVWAHVWAFSGTPSLSFGSVPVLTLGCALMLWNVISGPSWFERVLSSRPLRTVGRWSFSLYLWHWWPASWISGTLAARYGSNAVVQHSALALCLIVVIPVAALSYRLLERPYFRHGKSMNALSLSRPLRATL
jgi:peptidoglycan/LPS O-acetylase OafA/YrhL